MRTNDCDAATRSGRLRKAKDFSTVADLVFDLTEDDPVQLGSVYVTLAVHAGIAAADVVCCARLGQYARGDSHDEAVTLLRTVDKSLAGDLNTLLGLKTRAAYTAQEIGRQDLIRAQRAAEKLVAAAELAA